MSENPQNTDKQEIKQDPPAQGQFESLIADIDRIKKRHKLSKRQINDSIDKVINNLNNFQNSLDEMKNGAPDEENDQMDEEVESEKINEQMEILHNNLVSQKPLKTIFNNHKEYFAYLSKIGKNIEKQFNRDINEVQFNSDFDPDLIHKIIGDHLLRDGQHELCKIIEEETGSELKFSIQENLDNIQKIYQSIGNQQLDEAIEWANKEAENLILIESNLLFSLHSQKFLSFVKNSQQKEAIEYSRKFFIQFSQDHEQEIQKLMTTLLHMGSLEQSPYAKFFEEENWERLKQQFLSDSCKIYKILPESALLQVSNAGTLSLPKFIKLQSILQNNLDYQNKNNDIVIEFEHGNQFKYHSIFVCPVSREPVDPNQPPILLRCGHVISKISFDKITGNGQKQKFKCPTCQTQQKIVDSRKITF